MTSYRLKFLEERTLPADTIVFDAEDASSALIVASKEVGERSAELWQGDKRLCVLRRRPTSSGEFWEIS